MDAPILKEDKRYTVEFIETLPEGVRKELIDGALFDMAAPSTTHQRIITKMVSTLDGYFASKGGDCEVFPAPFAVYLNDDDRTYVEPDISVVCHPEKLDEKGCHGAPDLIIEIVSEFNQERDYHIKLFKYRSAGVREYWIINPMTKTVLTYVFDNLPGETRMYRFEEEVFFSLYPDLSVRLADFVK